MSYKPTCNIKWFLVSDECKEIPTAVKKGEFRFDDELYCLKQLWVSNFTNEPDQWRDIEVQA